MPDRSVNPFLRNEKKIGTNSGANAEQRTDVHVQKIRFNI
jgi:hypothetical protein